MSYINGLGMNLGNLSRISNAESRSITAKIPTAANQAAPNLSHAKMIR